MVIMIYVSNQIVINTPQVGTNEEIELFIGASPLRRRVAELVGNPTSIHVTTQVLVFITVFRLLLHG